MEFGAGVLARPKRDPYAYFEGGELPGADGAAEPLVPKRKEAGRRRRRDGSSVCGTFVNTLSACGAASCPCRIVFHFAGSEGQSRSSPSRCPPSTASTGWAPSAS